METNKEMPAQFMEKAALVSAMIHETTGMNEVFEKIIDICLKKPPREDLIRAKSTDTSKRIICAPNLDEKDFKTFEKLSLDNGIKLIDRDLRNHAGGIDVGFTIVDYGIAETGTLVLNSNSEDTRLATMLCEIHVALLPKSRLRQSALAMSEELSALTKNPSSYTAFITGASRTADIERVLALGVHGPLELHIMLVED